jgi:arylsulfatase A-like enzyme
MTAFRIVLALLAGLCFSLTPKEPHRPPAAPNVVFILADDLGWADLGCYGNPFNRTPNIDSLARQGLRFTQAYAAAPVCSPSRAAILTGKHPARLHLTNFLVGDRVDSLSPLRPARWRPYLPPAEVTMAEWLRGQGYATGLVGKWHLGGSGPSHGDSLAPWSQGFDYTRMIGYNGLDYYRYGIFEDGYQTEFRDKGTQYLTDKLTDYAVQFLEKNQRRPFFLYLTYSAPHIILVPRGDKLNHYLYKYEKFGGRYNPYYGAVVESLDDGVGRVLQTLRRLGLDENTLVVFTSDNGGVGLPELGPTPTSNAPLRSWKGHVYEGGIRVPLIFRWKGRLPQNQTRDAVVTGTDFLPTFADLLGLPPQPAPDGKSFAAVLAPNAAPFDRGPIFWHYPHFSNQLGRPAGAVREGDFKLIEWYETGKTELFNVKADVSEKTDLSAKNPEKARRLRHLLQTWRQAVGANMPEPNPAYTRR